MPADTRRVIVNLDPAAIEADSTTFPLGSFLLAVAAPFASLGIVAMPMLVDTLRHVLA